MDPPRGTEKMDNGEVHPPARPEWRRPQMTLLEIDASASNSPRSISGRPDWVHPKMVVFDVDSETLFSGHSGGDGVLGVHQP
jgi:hypothetical protein